MTKALGVSFGLLGSALAGCPPPVTICDAGGPEAAGALFTSFLASNSTCELDAGCVLIQNPCGLLDQCDLPQAVVPRGQQAIYEEEASKLTAEQCPAACLSQSNSSSSGGCPPGAFCGTPTSFDGTIENTYVDAGTGCGEFFFSGTTSLFEPVCVEVGGGRGQCEIFISQPIDAGNGFFEDRCNFGCTAEQFCDISLQESACPGQLGVFVLGDGGGECVNEFGSNGGSCSTSSDCGADGLCVSSDGVTPCAAGDVSCICESCPDNYPSSECPLGCQPLPLSDLRHCSVCLCNACPADAG